MKTLRLVGLVFAGLVLSFSLCLSAGAVEPIKIGVLGPMSFTQGEGHWNGATMAAEEINAAGGVKVGNEMRPLKLIKVDTNEFLSIPDATNAIEMAISRNKADFLVGGFRTEAVLVMQDIAMDAKKIFIGCGAAHPELCTRVTKDYDQYKYWFRVTPINSKFLGKVDFILLGTVGAIMKKAFNLDKIKVAVVAEKAAWADPIVAAAQKILPEKMGMEVVGCLAAFTGGQGLHRRVGRHREVGGSHCVYDLLLLGGSHLCQADGRTQGARPRPWASMWNPRRRAFGTPPGVKATTL